MLLQENILIEGKQIFLRSLREEDVYGRWWQWFNDPVVTEHMNKGYEANTPEKQLDFYRTMSASNTDLVLGICDRETQRHIGNTAIHKIREQVGKCVGNFGIIVGEKEFWGKGIGTESWHLMVHYAFEHLGLDAIETKIFSTNLASIRIAEKMGFQRTAVAKNELVKNGQPVDRLVFRLEKTQWQKNRK